MLKMTQLSLVSFLEFSLEFAALTFENVKHKIPRKMRPTRPLGRHSVEHVVSRKIASTLTEWTSLHAFPVWEWRKCHDTRRYAVEYERITRWLPWINWEDKSACGGIWTAWVGTDNWRDVFRLTCASRTPVPKPELHKLLVLNPSTFFTAKSPFSCALSVLQLVNRPKFKNVYAFTLFNLQRCNVILTVIRDVNNVKVNAVKRLVIALFYFSVWVSCISWTRGNKRDFAWGRRRGLWRHLRNKHTPPGGQSKAIMINSHVEITRGLHFSWKDTT
jgi:hypothetical protein